MSSPHLLQGSQRLWAFVQARAARPFAWGTSDCAVFAFDAVYAHTDRDLVRDLRGTYFSALSAARLLARMGGLEALADQRFVRRINAAEVRPGDVALLHDSVCDATDGHVGALGVALGTMVVAQGKSQLVAVPQTSAAIWWRPV